MAGGVPANCIAQWDGTNWSALGAGLTITTGTPQVFALTVYNDVLIAGGTFGTAGGTDGINNIAQWDGTQWSALPNTQDENGVLRSPSPEVLALTVYKGRLIVGGEFSAAGFFDEASSASNIAQWDGTSWARMGSGMSGGDVAGPSVASLLVNNGILIAGGDFTTAGGVGANGIATWAPLQPGTPSVSSPAVNTLDVAINPEDSDAAFFAIRINGGALTNQFVQADGTVGPAGGTPVWRTKADWGTRSVSGLVPNTTYSFDVQSASDTGGSCSSSFSSKTMTMTLCAMPATPGAPDISGETATSLNVANNAADSDTSFFAFRVNGGSLANQFIQADGSAGPSAVWQTKAAWGIMTVKGLDSGTIYTFDLQAANDSSGACSSTFGLAGADETAANAPSSSGCGAGASGAAVATLMPLMAVGLLGAKRRRGR